MCVWHDVPIEANLSHAASTTNLRFFMFVWAKTCGWLTKNLTWRDHSQGTWRIAKILAFQSTRCENHTACEPCEWQVSRRPCRRDTEYIGMQRRAKLLKIRLEFSSSMTWNQSAVLCSFRIYAQNWSHLSTMVKHRYSDDLPNWW